MNWVKNGNAILMLLLHPLYKPAISLSAKWMICASCLKTNVKAGDHIVSVEKPYSWAQHMFNVLLPRFGVTATYVDGTRIENFERAILPNTSVIYLESPNSWSFALQDLTAVAELAKAEGIITICDNSYC